MILSEKTPITIDEKSEPNLVYSKNDVDNMLDGGISVIKFSGPQFKNNFLVIAGVMREAISESMVKDKDFLALKHYSVMVFQYTRKMLYHILDRNFIHILHIEPLFENSPSEFWLMSQETKDEMNRYENIPKDIAKKFIICENQFKIKKGHVF